MGFIADVPNDVLVSLSFCDFQAVKINILLQIMNKIQLFIDIKYHTYIEQIRCPYFPLL